MGNVAQNVAAPSSFQSPDRGRRAIRRSARLRNNKDLKANEGFSTEGMGQTFIESRNKRKRISSIVTPEQSKSEHILKKDVKVDFAADVAPVTTPNGKLAKSATRVKRKKIIPGPDPSELKRLQREMRAATSQLAVLHPEVVDRNQVRRQEMLQSCGFRSSLIDAVISTMLSQNTTDANSKAAFKNLKRAFPTWDAVLSQTTNSSSTSQSATSDEDIVITKLTSAIRVAGLAKTRAERILALLRTIYGERGELSLEYLRDMSDDDVKKELGRFKGLGPKTVSCVLLFGLGRDSEFPVDTHVLRISKQMNWIPSTVTTREDAYEYLNQLVPNDVKLDLHCLLVTHGKQCHRCAANGKPQFPPKDGTKLNCPMVRGAVCSAEKIEDENVACSVALNESHLIKIKSELSTAQVAETEVKARALVKEEAVLHKTLYQGQVSDTDAFIKIEHVG